jgi:SAM-dependent methyltransferase
MDPTPEMLGAARALASGIANIRFVAGSSYDLAPALGRFHLVVMGRSFHWMDRVDTLRRLDSLIEPAGAVALLADSAPAVPENAWRKTWQDICARYEPKNGAHRSDPNWIRHEAILLDSPFARLERFGVIERRALDAEMLVQRTLSMGSTSPSHLGERKTAAIAADIRSAFADLREEWWRPPRSWRGGADQVLSRSLPATCRPARRRCGVATRERSSGSRMTPPSSARRRSS